MGSDKTTSDDGNIQFVKLNNLPLNYGVYNLSILLTSLYHNLFRNCKDGLQDWICCTALYSLQ